VPHADALDWLRRQVLPDGSWPFVPGDPGAPEPTVLAVAAGLPPPLAWLDTTPLGYAELLLPAAMSRRPEAAARSARAIEMIRASRGEVVDAELAFDTAIPAWSWIPGTAPWVEPTSYAVISLRRTGRQDDPRCQDGVRMLVDRQCHDGGWNYGNPAMLGVDLESDFGSTGWALLALPTSPVTTRGLARMAEALRWRTTSSLALGALAACAHGADPAPFLDALGPRQAPDGGFSGRVDWTALAALAFETAQTGASTLVGGP
jgi:hypothetical protein